MIGLASCLVDTNILIRTVRRQGASYPEVSGAVDMLLSASTPLFYAHQNIAEMWNVMTRPVDKNGLGLELDQADQEVRAVERAMKLLPENKLVYGEWRRLLVKHHVRGVQVHDTRLVATTLANGIEHILTLNIADFARFSEIQALHPRAVLQAAS